MGAKVRLDTLLVARGLSESREKARRIIMSGAVYVGGNKEDKAGAAFPDDEGTRIEIKGNVLRYVSRGGLKLEKALDVFGIGLKGLTVMDVGASTGGFTDCMLQNGAARVYAVDAGYGQLDWRLRNDPRVIPMEKTNVRYITPRDIGEELDFATADVSFISLDKVLPAVEPLLKDGAGMVCLIKPQFEAGRAEVGKKGVVRDASVHERVINRILELLPALGFSFKGLDFSPVKGPEGNIEYLIYFEKRLEGTAEPRNQEDTVTGAADNEDSADTVTGAADPAGQLVPAEKAPAQGEPHPVVREVVKRAFDCLNTR